MTHSELPVVGNQPTLIEEGYLRAGGLDQELRLNDSARAMLMAIEIRIGARLRMMYVLRPAWLGSNGWRIGIRRRDGVYHRDETLARVLQSRGVGGLFGVAVDARWPGPSAVWRVTPDAADIEGFRVNHSWADTLLFPEDRSLALLCHEDDPMIIAGPPDFVRAALDDDPEAARAECEAGLDSNNPLPPCYLDLLAHYAPYLLTTTKPRSR